VKRAKAKKNVSGRVLSFR